MFVVVCSQVENKNTWGIDCFVCALLASVGNDLNVWAQPVDGVPSRITSKTIAI